MIKQPEWHSKRLIELHTKALTEFASRPFCSRKDAARYLDISDSYLDELLYSQRIRSHYEGRLRKVHVASLLAYVDKLPIDPPEAYRSW